MSGENYDLYDKKLMDAGKTASEYKPLQTEQVISSEKIKELNFGYEKTENNFVSNLKNQYEGDNSLTGMLALNEQVQSLLNDILYSYGDYIKQDETVLKKIIEKKKNREKGENQNNEINDSATENGQIVELFEEYLLNNDSQEGFEQFLLSNGCIRDVILSYLQNHINNRSGTLNINLISKNDIKAKIKAEWHKKLYMDYNEKYGLKPNEELVKLSNIGKLIKNTIDDLVSQYPNGLGNEKFLKSLEGLLTNAQNNEKFKKMIKSDHFNFLLRSSIKEYSRLLDIGNKNRSLQKTGDSIFDTQLRAYLFLYGKIFYPDIFKSNGGTLDKNEGELGMVLDAILVADGKLDKDEGGKEKEKYYQAEEVVWDGFRKQEKSARERAGRKRAMRHHMDRNNGESQLSKNIENKNLDIQNASGVEIAQEMGLGKSLEGFKMKEIQSNNDIIFRSKIAFKKTCSEFLAKNRKEFQEFGLRISELFRIDNDDSKLLVNNGKLKLLSNKLNGSEINKVRRLIYLFIEKFNDNMNQTDKKMDEKKDAVHNIVKEYAIGAVIDNVKDMFQSIIETSKNGGKFLSGFEFDGNESAKINGNNLILSGKFNGENLVLRYDLTDGSLYMNSYISKNIDGTMVIGDNSPKLKIGELKPFQNILDDFYKSPTESMSNDIFPRLRRSPISQSESRQKLSDNTPRTRRFPRRGIEARKRLRQEHKRKLQEICGTKLDEINRNIKDKAESKTTQDGAVSNLLKTLNIMSENNNNKIINLKNNSDLYNIVQTITNSENDDINYFSSCLGKLMKYIGLNWGSNNLLGQDKTTKYAKLVFDNNNSGEFITPLREKAGNFNDEYNLTDGKLVFDSGLHFGILDLINEKFVEGEQPNGKLKLNDIKKFMDGLETELSIHKANNMDNNSSDNSKELSKLEEQLGKAYTENPHS